MTTKSEQIQRLAALELGALTYSGAFDASNWDGVRIHDSATPVYDLNGELLFHRVPLSQEDGRFGYVDMAAHEDLGGPLLAASFGVAWDEAALRKAAQVAATRKLKRVTFTRMRFVAFSFPKIAVQFLDGSDEVLMLELFTWEPVPPASRKERSRLKPSNFERWSLLDELPAQRKRTNARNLHKRLAGWNSDKVRKKIGKVPLDRVSTLKFKSWFPHIKFLFDRRELHYSSRAADHYTCYEVRGQETNVWCVGASAQMLLDFYRYEYTQTRLAVELGLGTLANPNGLPYARVGDVVTVVEAMSSAALDCTMITNPSWNTFRDEIRENRPLISFVPGHSRTVAGYTRSLLHLPWLSPFRGLLVYDPWPPNAGVITRWENFDTQTYQYAYTATVSLA